MDNQDDNDAWDRAIDRKASALRVLGPLGFEDADDGEQLRDEGEGLFLHARHGLKQRGQDADEKSDGERGRGQHERGRRRLPHEIQNDGLVHVPAPFWKDRTTD